MSDILNTLTKQIAENQILPSEQMTAGFDEMMEGKASPVQMAAFLIALKMRGEAPSDIAAGAGLSLQKVGQLMCSPHLASILTVRKRLYLKLFQQQKLFF